MQPIQANSRNAIVPVSLQYRKTSWMNTKIYEILRILKFINSREFAGVPVVVWYRHNQIYWPFLSLMNANNDKNTMLTILGKVNLSARCIRIKI